MVNLVKQSLDKAKMTLLGTLLVINVHLRDVLEELANKHLESLDSFEWYK